ncbi:MAG: hypothetical protein AAFR93_16455 [Pseudomonadota bacterium]
MTGPPIDGEQALTRRLEEARTLYRELTDLMRAQVDAVRKGKSEEVLKLTGTHLKQLQTMQELEGRLGILGKDGTVALDLDAARREIRERLLRLRGRG